MINIDDLKKARRIIHQQKPQVIKIGEIEEKKPNMMSTDEQIEML